MTAAAAEVFFRTAGCTGQLCVQSLDGSQEVAIDADQPVVPASVVKVSVALAAEIRFADGRLDPRQRVVLAAARRTPGPVGFSLFRDDVSVSLQDLVAMMLTISDNDATDALLRQIGLDAVNECTARLGLTGTLITSDLRTMINSLGQAAGFADWPSLSAWAARPHPAAEEARITDRIADALVPEQATRTTPRDMVALLRLIWTGQAGPGPACQRIRELMGQQLTRHRLAAAFPPPARVFAKSGGLAGVIRNEAGVIEYPDGQSYAAAVFTQCREPGHNDAINTAIGAAAAAAVEYLRGAAAAR